VDACIAALGPAQARLIASEDAAEGVQSFVERRAAKFVGR
jgi:enoyl-CoA hydratase/carnithine racemase